MDREAPLWRGFSFLPLPVIPAEAGLSAAERLSIQLFAHGYGLKSLDPSFRWDDEQAATHIEPHIPMKLVDEAEITVTAGNGGNVDDPHKADPLDFVLWQPSADDEPSWPSLWGSGRPGWHIECSALALRELGTTIDLHGGGSDLIFPHHECEAAQSRAATGELFVKHWMHIGMVRMHGEKMSKSLGNLVFVDELLERWSANVIRVAVLSHPYRHEWDWTESLMPNAAERMANWRSIGEDNGALNEVRSALDDDLDTPSALQAIDSAAAKNIGVGKAAALLGVLL